jgi:hypothetical protein
VAADAAFVIGATVTAVTAARIKFAFDFVHGGKIAAMRCSQVRAIAVFQRRLNLCLVGMAVIAE